MKEDPEVIEYIDQFPGGFRAIMLRLRELVYQVVPDASEAIKWRAVTFSYQNRPVCYISGFKNHVSLSFHDGTMLRDPNNLLHGTGKFLRFIHIHSLQDLDEEQVKFWILEAFYI